jgi:hypothetical protein
VVSTAVRAVEIFGGQRRKFRPFTVSAHTHTVPTLVFVGLFFFGTIAMSSEKVEQPVAAAAPPLEWSGVQGKPNVEVRKLAAGGQEEGLFATSAFPAGSVVIAEHAFASVGVDCPAVTVGLGAQMVSRLEHMGPEVFKQYSEPNSLGLFAPADLEIEIGDNLRALLEQSGMVDLPRIKKFAAAVAPYAVRTESLLRGSVPNINVHPICGKANHSCAPSCIAAGTLVSLADGTAVPIEDVAEGSLVLSRSRGQSGIDGLTPRSVSAVLNQGKRECLELLFDDGRTITCTPDHRFLTFEGKWIKAQDMILGETELSASVEYPRVDRDAEPLSDLLWELSVTENLGYNLNMRERRMHSLAFARLLGYTLTDGTVTDDEICVYLGHEMDVNAVQRDLLLLTGRMQLAKPVKNVWQIRLPASLTRAFLQCDVQPGARVRTVSHFPKFICQAACPIAIIREFAGALFGGDGTAPCVSHSHGSPAGYHPIRFAVTKKGSVLREQQQIVITELYAVLHRLGITADDLAQEIRSSNATSVTAVGRALIAHRKATQAPLSHAVFQDSGVENDISYSIVVRFRRSATLIFMSNIGFRYCVHKQTRLIAAAMHERQARFIMRQRLFIIEHVKKCIASRKGQKFGNGGLAKAVQAAKEDLRSTEILHPDVVQWCSTINEVLKLRVSIDKVGYTVAESLDRWATRMIFSDPRISTPYRAKSSGSEMEDVDAEAQETKDSVEPGSRLDANFPDHALPAVTQKVRYGVQRNAGVLPFFKVMLVGKREVGIRQVYDLSVPTSEGEDFCSFSPIGLCAHNCLAVWNANGSIQHLVAIRDIKAGEELTVTYWLDLLTDTRNVRQVMIRSKQGWVCQCTRCGGAPSSSVDSTEEQKQEEDCADVFARLRIKIGDDAEFQRAIGDRVTELTNAVNMKPGFSRNGKIRFLAFELLSTLQQLGVVKSEPSLVWYAASWFLRSSPDTTTRSGKADIKRACELLWAASVSTKNTADLPLAVPLLASLWIYHVLEQAHLPTKDCPRALLAAFQQHRAVRRTVESLEALPNGAQSLTSRPLSSNSSVAATVSKQQAHSFQDIRARHREKLAQRTKEAIKAEQDEEEEKQKKEAAAASNKKQ